MSGFFARPEGARIAVSDDLRLVSGGSARQLAPKLPDQRIVPSGDVNRSIRQPFFMRFAHVNEENQTLRAQMPDCVDQRFSHFWFN